MYFIEVFAEGLLTARNSEVPPRRLLTVYINFAIGFEKRLVIYHFKEITKPIIILLLQTFTTFLFVWNILWISKPD